MSATVELYPLRFHTIFKDKLWGGHKIKTILGKDFSPLPNCGETWELSAVTGNVSIVANGDLSGRPLNDIIKEYKQAVVGNRVWESYGADFPLLIKFIDAADDLSIQVHPDDTMAAALHNSKGKTEMWYVLSADPGAQLNVGFSKPVQPDEYANAVASNNLAPLLNMETVQAGDIFYLPAGRIHYIGKGILLAEVQQTSDITYRVYDFDRVDAEGNKRELHTDLAQKALDYTVYDHYKTDYTPKKNEPVSVVQSPYFTTEVISINQNLTLNYSNQDSFRILIVTKGNGHLRYADTALDIKMGDVVLLPAVLPVVELQPRSEGLDCLHVTI